jgi:hypothetical protein
VKVARRQLLGFAVLVVLPWATIADEPPKPIGPAEAAKKVGEQVTLRMEVKSAALRSGVCFLNSEEDYQDAKNFTVFLDKEALQKFKEAKIDDPAAHFKGKAVQVKGKEHTTTANAATTAVLRVGSRKPRPRKIIKAQSASPAYFASKTGRANASARDANPQPMTPAIQRA